MPQVIIDIDRVDRIPGAGRIVEIEAVYDNQKIIRTINIDDFANFTEFADWLINQSPDRESQEDWRRRLVIDFHTEEITDPETGAVSTVREVDGVEVGVLE